MGKVVIRTVGGHEFTEDVDSEDVSRYRTLYENSCNELGANIEINDSIYMIRNIERITFIGN